MRKLLVVLVMLLSIVGCSKPQEIVEVRVEGASTASEMTFCKEGYCSDFSKDNIDVYGGFIEEMVLVESSEDLGDEWMTIKFDEHSFTYYSNDMVKYNDVVYTVSNIETLKGNQSHEYKLEIFGSKLYPLKDIVENYELDKIRLEAGYKGIPSYDLYIKDESIKKIILDALDNVAVMEYGFPVYGAGGGPTVIIFNGAEISEGNGTRLTVEGTQLTGKNASCIGGDIYELFMSIPQIKEEYDRLFAPSVEYIAGDFFENEYIRTEYVIVE